MCTCIIYLWTRQLFSTTLIGPVEFGGRELCVLELHSAGLDSYLILL
jgi:hypothetical protein